MHHPETAPARLATRLAFFEAGFATACWAPLVPFAKANVGADEALFGMLLLCLGIGSLIAMPVTGWLAARNGARSMVILAGLVMPLVLPLLVLAGSVPALAGALLLFGAGLGSLDVSMNIHAVEVENRENRPLMSGFHALFSVGGFVGSGVITLLLTFGVSPFQAASVGTVLALAVLALTAPRLLRARADAPEAFALPRGLVLLVAGLAAVSFLIEGALMDWGALVQIERGLADATNAGFGYMVFSVTMVAGRLTGDRTVSRFGSRKVLIASGLITFAGLALILLAPAPMVALAGFALVGIGAANIVPVLFSIAGRQKIMPAGMAIAAVTTTGYAGVLLGPAAIGFVAHASSLTFSFWLLAVLVLVVPLSARTVTRI
ncbi:MFS transporter [Donghicola sp. C2-DW-16]|uniref:MFS transporter n=1 Tax=Donghicola mangrovi TaxID=2729614 RepID=A0ABX2PF27_9RHOB|nr:MFS transporter [Donghicola mangrovi]NVO28095.1 MFS transporter [Donghicola mangrovi]